MTNRFIIKRYLALALVLLLIFAISFSFAAKKKYDTWQDVAIDMGLEFDKAIDNIENQQYEAAYQNMNDAYFGYYEVQGFEKNVMVYISRDRVNLIESSFSEIKHSLLGNQDFTAEQLLRDVELLKLRIFRDAMVLDGVAAKDSADDVGMAVFGDDGPRYLDLAVEQTAVDEADNTEPTSAATVVEADPNNRNWATFITTFGLLLREGLEAILVIVAIIAYLVKTGNDHLKKHVYWGVLAGIVGSILLAVAIELLLGGSGVAQEMIEGWTMFLAVAVLFYVSHWMLHKSEAEAWQNYINQKVEQSIDKKNANALVFAAFLAVLREGAELILFYKAAFSGGMSDPLYITLGIVVGVIVLAIIYILYRYFTVKLPIRPFFMATSILLFLMCISFMGKGVIELGEAGVISGHSVIPALAWLKIDILNIYNRAETLIPQIMLAIASLWLIINSMLASRKAKKAIQ